MGASYSWLPGVDTMLNSLKKHNFGEEIPHALLADGARLALREFRELIAGGNCHYEDKETLQKAAFKRGRELVFELLQKGLHPMINATGIVLHTNLGRSPLSKAAKKAILAASDYCNLELDSQTGSRGDRHSLVEGLLQSLSGAEGSLIVNNNAAALLLALDTFARGREVIVSRGELVEIGGSFRVPDIMAKSGCGIREIGTTNKTHLKDYQNAVNENTALFLRVHPSNFTIQGFTERPKLKDLCSLAHENRVPVLDDLGSGCIYPLSRFGIGQEPLVAEEIAAGADIITFSGDKLLGGPQAGIILGKRAFIKKMKENPLTRAFRVDKLCLAALEATLRTYLNLDKAAAEIPLLQMLLKPAEEIYRQSQTLLDLLKEERAEKRLCLEIEPGFSPVGGGALPGVELPTWLVKAAAEGLSPREFALRLRGGKKGIMAYIREEKLVLDLRTISQDQISDLARGIKAALK